MRKIEEDVPVFSLQDHPDYEYRISDVVLMLPPVTQMPTLTSHVAGEITDICDGKLKVHWAKGDTSWVYPDQIVPIEAETQWSQDVRFWSLSILLC